MYELRLSEDKFRTPVFADNRRNQDNRRTVSRSAVDTYSGRPVPLTHEEAEAVVAKVLANSGRSSVKVRYEAEDEGAACAFTLKRGHGLPGIVIGIKRGERAQLL